VAHVCTGDSGRRYTDAYMRERPSSFAFSLGARLHAAPVCSCALRPALAATPTCVSVCRVCAPCLLATRACVHACMQRPRKAHPVELAQFHSEDYVEFLSKVDDGADGRISP
jgi:hypothetical protein